MSLRLGILVAVAAAAIVTPAFFAFGDDDKPGTPAGQPSAQPGTPPAGPRGPRERGPREGGGPGERGMGDQVLPPNIRQAMKLMGRSVKALSGSVGDAAKKDESLKQVADFQRGCLAAKNASPSQFLDKVKDPAAKEKAAKAFRPQLVLMMKKSLDLETAILDGKTADATKIVAEMNKLKDDSHGMIGAEED